MIYVKYIYIYVSISPWALAKGRQGAAKTAPIILKKKISKYLKVSINGTASAMLTFGMKLKWGTCINIIIFACQQINMSIE